MPPMPAAPAKSGRSWLRRLFAQEPEDMPFVPAYMRRKPTNVEDTGSGHRKKLGVMIGVFLPSLQNVFGVIMFLRLCWMVGMLGIWECFLMVFLCCLTTFLTTLSVSAIATNGVMESGGTYFMLSRSLGPHLGVACGILFYLANTIAVAMYIVGACEIFLLYMAPRAFLFGWDTEEELTEIRSSTTEIIGVYNNHVRIYGLILLAFIFCVICMGVRVVQLFAPWSLFGVIISILAIYAGAIEKTVDPDSRPQVCVTNPECAFNDSLRMPGPYLLASKSCREEQYRLTCTSNIYDCKGCLACPGLGSPIEHGQCDAGNGTPVGRTECRPAITGFRKDVFMANLNRKYSPTEKTLYRWRRGDQTEGAQEDWSNKEDTEHQYVMNHQITTFFVIMGIYFPSVTGILTGTNMSGDLADPQRSIPSGTLAAQLTTSFVYLSFVVIFGACIEPGVLLDKNGDSIEHRMTIGELAWPTHWVVVVGCFLSTFGAGLQSLCSAPRLLASIAKDNVIPFLHPFAKLNCINEPFNALLLTTAISFVCLMIALLDYVAPLVAMFFLQLYAFVNLACAVMTLVGSPGWRPRYKGYHWSLSLFGFFLAYFIMFSTFWYFALGSVVVGLSVAVLVAWKGQEMEWGDGSQGLFLSLAQFFLLKLEGIKTHAKNWRPQILILNQSSHPESLRNAFTFIQQLKASKGLLMVANLVELEKVSLTEEAKFRVGWESGTSVDPEKLQREVREEMRRADIRGFVENVFYRKGKLGPTVGTLIQTAGISGLKPNTIFAEWPTEWQLMEDELWAFLDRIHRATRYDHCLLIVKGLPFWPDALKRRTGTMDIWWIIRDGGLLLLVAHLLRKHRVWSHTRLRLFLISDSDEDGSTESTQRYSDMEQEASKKKQAPKKKTKKSGGSGSGAQDRDASLKESVERLLYQLRIAGEVKVVVLGEEDTEAYRRSGQESAGESSRAAVLKALGPKEADLDLQAVADKARQLPSTTQHWDPFNQSHPQANFTFSKIPPPDDASYLEQPVGAGKEDEALKTARAVSEEAFNQDTCKAARVINAQLRRHSADADVLILNLPQPPRSPSGMYAYMLYMHILVQDLPRIILVRGTGNEVITMYQ